MRTQWTRVSWGVLSVSDIALVYWRSMAGPEADNILARHQRQSTAQGATNG